MNSNQVSPDNITLEPGLLDDAINWYLENIPQDVLFEWIYTGVKLVGTKRDREEQRINENGKKKYIYDTYMKCTVEGTEYLVKFSKQSLSALRSIKNTDQHRLRGKATGEKDTPRMFILAGILAEYLYKKENFQALSNNNRVINLKSDTSISSLMPLAKSCLSGDRPTICLLKKNDSATFASSSKFSTDENCFKQFFFVGPGYQVGNTEQDYEQIKLLWRTNRLSTIARDKFKSLFCGEDSESKNERNKLRESILAQASRFPLVASLNKPGKYLELHELLRQITRFESKDIDNTIQIKAKVRPPFTAIRNSIFRPLYDRLKNKMYTGYDYILAHGRISEIARENDNHSFSKKDLPEDLWPFVDDGYDFEHLMLVDKDQGLYKYRTKQHRIFIWSASEAFKDTRELFEHPFTDRTQEELRILFGPPEAYDESILNENSGVAKRHYSGWAWSFVVFLSYCDSIQRQILIKELERLANNFDPQPMSRIRQEMCLSIGSYLLLEKSTEFSREDAESLFFSFYARTLYEPQAEMWPLLRDSSGIFVDMAKKWFRAACIGQERAKDAPVLNPDRQPYFNFLQGDLYADEELNKLPASLRFTIEACKLQKVTWYLSPDQERQSIKYDIVEEIFKQLRIGLVHMEHSTSLDDMSYVIGVSMLLYCMANLKNRESEFKKEVCEVQERIHNPVDHDILIKSILLSDYFSRLKNVRYAKQENDCHIICGGIRAVCAYEFGPTHCFPVQEYLDSLHLPELSIDKLRSDYKKWIDFHLSGRPRQAFLIYRLLSYYNFGNIDTFESFMNGKEDLRLSYRNFLPYDQMCGDVSLFLKDPTKLWTKEIKKAFYRYIDC